MRVVLAMGCGMVLAWAVWPMPAQPVLATTAAPLTGAVRVVDGDTLDMGGLRLRLQGVDAPERRAACQDAQGQPWNCADWSADRLRALVGTRELACRDLGERSHDRIVVACTLDGQDLGARLVAEGIARACPRYARRHLHSQGYEALEVRAIAARAGLHAGTSPPRARFCEPRGA